MIKVKCTYCNNKYDYGTQCECEQRKIAKKEAFKRYDQKIRRSKENKKYDDFYHSIEWERLRDHIKAKYNGLCLHCLLINDTLTTDSILVHHIESIKSKWELRLFEDNCITLCINCHNNNTIHDDIKLCLWLLNQYEQVYII